MRKQLALCLALLGFCSPVVAESNFFILPAEKGAALLQQCSRSTPQGVEGFWKPSAAEISGMENRLVLFLKTDPSKIVLSDFRRQYVGFSRGGKRYIYGNFYRASLPVTLKNEDMEPVMVCDGGPSFWGIVFSVDTKEFQELAFNGMA